jgi:hypothetical protein
VITAKGWSGMRKSRPLRGFSAAIKVTQLRELDRLSRSKLLASITFMILDRFDPKSSRAKASCEKRGTGISQQTMRFRKPTA